MREALRALPRLRDARDLIVRIAAQWQADGLDTSPLAAPLADVQEAIADIEAIIQNRDNPSSSTAIEDGSDRGSTK